MTVQPSSLNTWVGISLPIRKSFSWSDIFSDDTTDLLSAHVMFLDPENR